MTTLIDPFHPGALAFGLTDTARRNVQLHSPDEVQELILANIAGSAAVAAQTVTPHFVGLAASSSQVIPAGAKGWSVSFLTGTGTIGGVAVPAGFSDSDPGTLAAAITVATNAGSTAYVRWST